MEGRYTKRAGGLFACDLVAGAPVVFWLTNFQLVDSMPSSKGDAVVGQGAGGTRCWIGVQRADGVPAVS